MFRLQDAFDWRAQQEPYVEVGRDTTGRILTRGDLCDRSNRVAHGLRSAGLRPGDRFATLAKNWLDYVTVYLGAAKAGAVLVPLNYRLTTQELAYVIDNAEARLLIARGEFVTTALSLQEKLTGIEHVVAVDDSVGGGALDFEVWLEAQPSGAPDVDLCDEVILMYTSGTTGLPKGVVMTHEYALTVLEFIRLTNDDLSGARLQVVAPFYHAAAAMSALAQVSTGGTVYVHEEFDPAEVVRVLDEEGIGFTFLAPVMVQALLTTVPDVASRSYRDLRRIVYGGSPMAEETLRKAIDVFGCGFAGGYGQTEALSLTFLSERDHARALSTGPIELLGSCGRAGVGVAIAIVDERGTPLPRGEVGEIVVRAPGVMSGYWKLPEATAETLRDGWLHTGDAGCLDAAGYLYIKDRVKDMIVSGAENIYPVEIEQVLVEHPAVADAAVIGIPDERWGEAVHAVIQRLPGSDVEADDIIAFCRERVARYKRPRSVEFVDMIPRNASGKIQKTQLRAPFWEGRDRAVN